MPRRDDVMSSEDATMVASPLPLPLPLPLESSDDATMAAEDRGEALRSLGDHWDTQEGNEWLRTNV